MHFYQESELTQLLTTAQEDKEQLSANLKLKADALMDMDTALSQLSDDLAGKCVTFSARSSVHESNHMNYTLIDCEQCIVLRELRCL
jgi:hypothetical protein